MLYTILGAVLGGVGSYVLFKVCDVDFRGSRFFPGIGQFGVIFTTLMGVGIGFGYEYALLMSGNHPFNKFFLNG